MRLQYGVPIFMERAAASIFTIYVHIELKALYIITKIVRVIPYNDNEVRIKAVMSSSLLILTICLLCMAKLCF